MLTEISVDIAVDIAVDIVVFVIPIDFWALGRKKTLTKDSIKTNYLYDHILT